VVEPKQASRPLQVSLRLAWKTSRYCGGSLVRDEDEEDAGELGVDDELGKGMEDKV